MKRENREGVVRFEEISGSAMVDVLEFIYTGTVEVTQKNAEELIAAGNYLIIPNLKTVSAGSHLCSFGERNPDIGDTFVKAERFDTVENKWEEIADMLEGRSAAFGVASQENNLCCWRNKQEREITNL
ncbi:hypothetical protein AWC38_SpisGene24246 [Stylophora pistillata]|uniref:BTB domain-containing protein n=1 Tax=Stylophora pistillata TaxID=50429 RepID=A0A2B4R6I0_STYPI|nr:hypothetical protein AWC38_SpisGene24246 [Stylophora pistillata]